MLDAAAGGDPTARRIISAQGTTLGDYALAAARQVGLGGAACATPCWLGWRV